MLPWRPDGGFVERLRQEPGSYEALRSSLEAELLAQSQQPEVREALSMASASVRRALEAESSGKTSAPRELARTVFGYQTRSSSRSTPFGLFATLSVGQIAPQTELALAERSQLRRHVELDAGVGLRLARSWEGLPGVRPQLRYWPTPQRVEVGGVLRCVPVEADGSASLVEVKLTASLRDLLVFCEQGRRFEELLERLGDRIPQSSLAQRQAYLEELLEAGVLVSELLPTTTGAPWLEQLLVTSGAIAPLREVHAALVEVKQQVDAMERSSPSDALEQQAQIRRRLEQEPLGVAAEPSLMVNLWRPAHASLGPRVVQELLAIAELLVGLPSPDPPLREFVERFQTRYEGRQVPLLEVLFGDAGESFARTSFQEELPLLEGVARLPPEAEAGVRSSGLERYLLPRLLEATALGSHDILLRKGELPAVAASAPVSFAVCAALAARSAADVDRGEFRVLDPLLIAPGAGRLLGRFCQGDASLREQVRKLVEAERQADAEALWADVIDLGYDVSSANIVRHPVLRELELVVQGRSGAEPAAQISLQDLLVGVEGQRVYLFSRRLGRRIKPRALNALNSRHPRVSPLREFLGAIERQDNLPARLDWGMLEHAPFLPRLRYGRAVLRPARWRLDEATRRQLHEAPEGSGQYELIQSLREQHRWPRWVRVQRREQTLTVDLDHPLAVDSLVQTWKTQAVALVEEFLPALEPPVVGAPEGAFLHEVIVPFVNSGGGQAAAPRPRTPAVAEHERDWMPGGELLYLKLYGDPSSLERVLLKRLWPLLREHAHEEAGGWFFVRYSDPYGEHLRLRVARAALDSDLARSLLGEIRRAQRRGEVMRLQIDTYEREVERYGGEAGLELSEKIFGADSECALALLEGADAEQRWQRALRGLDAWLDDLGLGLAERHALVASRAQSLERAQGSGEELGRSVGEKFRRWRSQLSAVFGQGSGVRAEESALARRSGVIRRWLTLLARQSSEGSLGQPLSHLQHSYLHMFCNRMFDRQRLDQELVLYHLLARHYRSALARG